MMTVRPRKEMAVMAMSTSDGGMAMSIGSGGEMSGMAMDGAHKPSPSVPAMTVVSFLALAAGLDLAFTG
jgi:hypothetical protein